MAYPSLALFLCLPKTFSSGDSFAMSPFSPSFSFRRPSLRSLPSLFLSQTRDLFRDDVCMDTHTRSSEQRDVREIRFTFPFGVDSRETATGRVIHSHTRPHIILSFSHMHIPRPPHRLPCLSLQTKDSKQGSERPLTPPFCVLLSWTDCSSERDLRSGGRRAGGTDFSKGQANCSLSPDSLSLTSSSTSTTKRRRFNFHFAFLFLSFDSMCSL